jgi:solute:Na+ symporter, SSS family
MNLPLLVIVGYLTLVTLIGMLAARRSSSSTDWAVAGGGMGVLMIAVGAAGTRIGGAGTYGVAGDVIADGVWNLWWYGISTLIAMALIGLFFAVPYRRARLQTVAEIFTIRFGARRSQVIASLCVQIEYFIVNVIEAYVIAVILRGLLGIDMAFGVMIAAFVLISYVTVGGLWGAAITNLIHCVVIIGGLALVNFMGIQQLGGWSNLVNLVDSQLASSGGEPTHFWNFLGMGLIPVIAMVFSVAIHTPAASVYTNYASSAKSEKVLLPSFMLAGVLGGLMPILAGGVGLLTIAHYGFESGTSGYANLTQVATMIHPIVGGIALAAVLAAVVSSGGPILLSSATMFVRDWLRVADNYTSDKKLRAYRIATVMYGLIAAAIAWVNAQYLKLSILDMLLFGYAMVVPPAIAVAYLIYWRKTTERGAFWGMVSGLVGGLLWFAAIQVADITGFEARADSSALAQIVYWCFSRNGGLDPSYLTTLIPLIVVPVLSLMTERRTEGEEHFYDVLAGRVEARFKV